MVRIAAFLLALCCAAGAAAQLPATPPQSAEDYAWVQIVGDRVADLGKNCGQTLAPQVAAGWDQSCRNVPAKWLVNLLANPKMADWLPQHGIRMIGANITGPLDLADTDIKPEFWLLASRIEGRVNLYDSHWHRVLSLRGTAIAGDLLAERLRSDSSVLIGHRARIDGVADLSGAKISGNLDFGGIVPVGRAPVEGLSVGGALNLNSVDVGGTLFLNASSKFGGEVNLDSANIRSEVDMDGSAFRGPIEASSIVVGGGLFLRKPAVVDLRLSLAGAKIGGNLEMTGSIFGGAVNLNRVTVGGTLFLNDSPKFGGEVNLVAANIGSAVDMDGSAFQGPIEASAIVVVGDLFLRKPAVVGGLLSLASARIGGNLTLEGSVFSGAVNLNRVTVGGTLFLNDSPKFGGEVNLVAANIGGAVTMERSAFAAPVMASGLRVGQNLFAKSSTFTGAVNLIGARIGEILDLTAVTARWVELSDADVTELSLTGLRWGCAPPAGAATRSPPVIKPVAGKWPLRDGARRGSNCAGAGDLSAPRLILRNTHVAQFQDDVNAWPPSLDLAGFHYDRLGGLGGSGAAEMEHRPYRQWIDWLARDPNFSAQPYAELATVLTTAGARDTADDVQFAGREREREEVRDHLPRWLWLGFLSWTAGYGIARYMWRVLIWVVLFTIIGFGFLWFSPNARRHGPFWMVGASLHRLLPVVSLYKEFDDFFDNPPAKGLNPRNLTTGQTVYFAIHAIVGWALGLILLAAMSGITQKG
jgi:hypothetical protein